VTEWTDEEINVLRRRWLRESGRMVMPGACPHCLHNGAFRHVVVHPRGAVPRGRGDDPPRAPEYPQWALVECFCGDESHGDVKGCRRVGRVSTSIP
jgi:hypothetical protein